MDESSARCRKRLLRFDFDGCNAMRVAGVERNRSNKKELRVTGEEYSCGNSDLTLRRTAILPEWLRGRTRNALAKAAKVRILRIANMLLSVNLELRAPH